MNARTWTPSAERVAGAALTTFADQHGLPHDYHALHRWSVADVDRFWATIWSHYALPGGYDAVRQGVMPDVRWFPGAQLNFAEQVFRDKADEALALQALREGGSLVTWDWGRLRAETARVRAGLEALGVGEGDRVAAYLPNVPETVAAFLATASLGAIWSCAAPELGVRAVTERFGQVEPKVLLAVDGYRYGGKVFDRSAEVREIHRAVGGALVAMSSLGGRGWPDDFGDEHTPLAFRAVAFDHPLWVLYSSGTTGLPKPIVHGHGGMLLEHLKYAHLHLDARAADRVLWFTTTGWMMWNLLVGVLLTEASIVLYDGSPAGTALWDLAATTRTTVFGTSAAFLAAAQKSGVRPREGRDLQIHAVGSTGSPLPAAGFRWVYDELGADTWLFSMSGGTDVCSAFLAGVPTLPVREGELQAAALGADVQAWAEDGTRLIGLTGELVVTQPLPSMPLGFWGDDDRRSRYREAYFAHFPGTWRHGDWVTMTEDGGAVVHGRSDATINRGGVRMGTAEICSAVLALDEVVDALVVDVPQDQGESWMPLFVVLRDGVEMDDALRRQLAATVRADCSPRHVPDEVFALDRLPKTLSGKNVEVPVKRVLAGEQVDAVVDRQTLSDPGSFDPFIALAEKRSGLAKQPAP